MTRRLSFVFLSLTACGGSPAPPAPAAMPSMDIPPLDAGAPAAERQKAPKLDATCAADAECEAVFVGDDCCSTCAPRIANKSWRRDIEAFCAKEDNRGKCESMGCSWGFSKPRCVKGLCQ